MSIDIANESGVDVDEAGLAAVARFALDRMRIHPLAELSILLVDEPAMAELHERWMGEPGPTDVLAFPMDELRPPQPGSARDEAADPGLLGDVVLCPQVAAEQAAKAGHGTQDELELLSVHGILHLLGYDHAEPDEHKAMFGLQDQLLKAWSESKGLCSTGCRCWWRSSRWRPGGSAGPPSTGGVCTRGGSSRARSTGPRSSLVNARW
jgi:probable rRNA maturation factor